MTNPANIKENSDDPKKNRNNTNNTDIKVSGSDPETIIVLNKEVSGPLLSLDKEIKKLQALANQRTEEQSKAKAFVDSLEKLQKSIHEDIEKKLSNKLSLGIGGQLKLENDPANDVCKVILKCFREKKSGEIAQLRENKTNLEKQIPHSITLAKDTADMLSNLKCVDPSQADKKNNVNAITAYGKKQFNEHSAGVKFLKNIFSVVFAGLNFIVGATLGFFEGITKDVDSIRKHAHQKGLDSFESGKEFGKHLFFQSPSENIAEKGRKFIKSLEQAVKKQTNAEEPRAAVASRKA